LSQARGAPTVVWTRHSPLMGHLPSQALVVPMRCRANLGEGRRLGVVKRGVVAAVLTAGLAASSRTLSAWAVPPSLGGHEHRGQGLPVAAPRPGPRTGGRPELGARAAVPAAASVQHAAGSGPRSPKALLCGALCAGLSASILGGVVSLAAEGVGAKRRRKAPVPVPSGGGRVDATSSSLDGLTADMASGLDVEISPAEREKRRARRLRKLQQADDFVNTQEEIVNVVKRLASQEDPDFFGYPFIWVQGAHLLLLITTLLAVSFSTNGDENAEEFVLFALPPISLAAVKFGFVCVYVINIFVAALLYFESSQQTEEERTSEPWVWAVKGFTLGGVASWQYYGQIAKTMEKDKQKSLIQARKDMKFPYRPPTE